MKVTIIPIILAVSVVIAGIIALSPVEQVSTAHTDVATLNVGVISLEKPLPDCCPADNVANLSWTFSVTEDAIIRAIWVHSEESYCVTAFDIGALEYRNSDDIIEFCTGGDDDDNVVDFLNTWERFVDDQILNSVNNWADYIPLEDGDGGLVLTFQDDNNNDTDGDLTVWIAYQDGGDVTLE